MRLALASVEVLPVDGRPSEPDGFREFVEARSSALLRSGWLLTGDWPSAEDLVQTALAAAWKPTSLAHVSVSPRRGGSPTGLSPGSSGRPSNSAGSGSKPSRPAGVSIHVRPPGWVTDELGGVNRVAGFTG